MTTYNNQERYMKEWDAKGYVSSRYCDARLFTQEFQHSLELLAPFPDGSLKMLEYSGGPSLMSLINKVPKASEFIFCDFLESNREEVKNWLNKDPGAHDWKPSISHCLKVEGSSGDNEDVLKREALLRDRIKAVVHCDLFSDNIIEEGYEGPYDIVNCEGVLDDLCASIEQLHEGIKKLSSLVKKGGYLILTTDDGYSYSFAGLEFTNLLEFTEDDILEAFHAAGFINVTQKTIISEESGDENYITIGQKP